MLIWWVIVRCRAGVGIKQHHKIDSPITQDRVTATYAHHKVRALAAIQRQPSFFAPHGSYNLTPKKVYSQHQITQHNKARANHKKARSYSGSPRKSNLTEFSLCLATCVWFINDKEKCTLSEMFRAKRRKSQRELNSTFLAKKQTTNLLSATKACWGSPLCHCSNNNMWFGCTAPVYSGKRRGAKLISDSVVWEP